MPVLEITQLRLKGIAADDPALLETLSIVRDKLQTNSQFYVSVEESELIFVLGIWPNLDAHRKFLASPAREEILGPQEDMLEFCWTIHVDFGGMHLIAADAPILAMERVCVEEEGVEVVERAVAKYMQRLKASHPFKIAHGWRCDLSSGNHEVLLIGGWETAQSHVAFTSKNDDDDDIAAAISERVKTLGVIYCRNIERKTR
ncbi:dimeric alpha-beta barrel [Pyrenophora seminiperda CCB06]|uniref:Dimeric alpha-beta barrel n=1 Tax=Pyrenophora seminiperda CCB06 TaxID=1302712 RepID=A0A3M7LV71_9PLEO|nr:dimeric alpha-beta barrel [Pyrenophora seminiperda CCB06]